MANTKGKNNSKNKRPQSNSKKRSTSNNSKSKYTSKKKTTYKEDEYEDPFFEDSRKEIVLWASLALCVLLIISNFGLGGTVGNTVSDFLFGTFGVVQFVLPLVAVFIVFFLISNYGNKVAVAKAIAGIVLLVSISTFIELIVNGTNVLGAVAAFQLSKNTHNGGGFIGGGIVTLLYDSFGLFGAYLIDIILIIVCIIIIIERFQFYKFRRSSQMRSELRAEHRKNERYKHDLERQATLTRSNSEREAIKNKIDQELALEKIQ